MSCCHCGFIAAVALAGKVTLKSHGEVGGNRPFLHQQQRAVGLFLDGAAGDLYVGRLDAGRQVDAHAGRLHRHVLLVEDDASS